MDIRKVGLVAAGLLVAAPACADPISGYVYANGTVAIRSSLYTVTHPQTGHYTITFATPLEPSANCIIMPLGEDKRKQFFSLAPFVSDLVQVDGQCSFKLSFSDHGTPANADFVFIAVPMSN